MDSYPDKDGGHGARAPFPTLRLSGRLARPEILDQPQQHPGAGIDIGDIDMLVRMMADAAAAAHEQHGDVGYVDHRHAIMPCPARQLEHATVFASDGFR